MIRLEVIESDVFEDVIEGNIGDTCHL